MAKVVLRILGLLSILTGAFIVLFALVSKVQGGEGAALVDAIGWLILFGASACFVFGFVLWVASRNPDQ